MDARKTGELIAALRKEKGWSQTELAERIGVTNKAVSRWETGRGYPDVELLPELAKELDITISELLEGERAPVPPKVDEQMEFLCENAGENRRRAKYLTAALIAVLILVCGLRLYPRLVGFAKYITGSPYCVIAADYSSLTYYGERYVPLPMEEIECRDPGRTLIEEAKVEGAGFWKKLLYGETLYAVSNELELDIVYLQTEYDDLLSPYFVRESEYDVYAATLDAAQYDVYCGVFWQWDGTNAIFPLEEQTVQLLTAAEQGKPMAAGNWGGTDWRIDVRAYESGRLFYKLCGELVAAGDRYYWSPCVYSEQTGTVTCGLQYYLVEGDLFGQG